MAEEPVGKRTGESQRLALDTLLRDRSVDLR